MLRKLRNRRPDFESLEGRTLLSTAAVPGVLDRTRVAALAAAESAPKAKQPTGSLKAAEAINATTIRLEFRSPISRQIAPKLRYEVDGLQVTNARMARDGRSVVLTTTPQDDDTYTARVTRVKGAAGKTRFASQGLARFRGAPAPRILEVAAIDDQSILVTYDRPMGGSAVEPQNYELTDEAGQQVAISGARFAGGDTSRVTLRTAPQSYSTYSFDVNNVTDTSGQQVFFQDRTFTGNPKGAVVSVAATSPTTVVVAFNEPMTDNALAPQHYSIRDPSGEALLVTDARFDGPLGMVVVLTTATQASVAYELTVSNVTDLRNDGLGTNTGSFNGIAAPGESPDIAGPPRVVGAASLNNTELIVSFSEPMAVGTARPEHFVITQENVNPEAGALLIFAAEFYNGDRSVVKLTTRSQNELTYRVTVVNATDRAGNALAPKVTSNGVLIDPTSATFPGTPPVDGITLVDSDGDGLTDNEEQRGWLISYRTADGRLVERMVTSDIFSTDTDGEGFTDDVEAQLKIDPRDPDTDDDLLTDWREYTEIFSNHVDADTDRDGVDDGTEFLGVRSSPNFADTDGDQIPDGIEIPLGGFYNILVANLPVPKIDVGDVDLSLRVDVVATSTKGTRKLDSKTAESTLTSTDNQSFSSTSESTHSAYAKAGVEKNTHTGIKGGISTDFKVSAEAGWSGSWRSEFTSSSSRETQRALSNARTTEKEVQVGEDVQTQVTDARIQTTINLTNASPIAYRLKNLQVTALMIDPRNPTALVPVATLVPEFEPEDGFAMGPLVPARGPIIVASQNVFPSRVEALMANPQSLVFQISNFDILDETGRNFAFASQEVVERTARIQIDYGGLDSDGDGRDDDTEILFISTAAGRAIADTNGDGTINGDDRRVTFDPAGYQVGRSVRDLLADTGLAAYTVQLDEDNNLVLDPDFDPALRVPIYYDADGQEVELTQAQIRNSYATMMVHDEQPDGTPFLRERIFRIRERANTDFDFSTWEILTPTGIDPDRGLDDIVYAGESFTLAFVQDRDGDFIPASLEAFYGSSDTSRDTDGDGLDDRFEALIGWDVNIPGRGIVRVTSSPRLADTDGDGLSDRSEAPGRWVDADGDGLIDEGELRRSEAFFGNGWADYWIQLLVATDPDGDGTYEAGPAIQGEMVGWTHEQRFNVHQFTSIKVVAYDDPLSQQLAGLYHMDENSDAYLDVVDIRNGLLRPFIDYVTDPTDPDSDRDRLGDFDEVDGFTYRPIDSTTDQVAFTNPERADTDGDSVNDGMERRFGLDPSDGLDRDSDGDGLPNRVETTGWDVSIELVTLKPLDVVRGEKRTFTAVASDPDTADTDGDGLTDFEEYFLKTLPDNLFGLYGSGVDSDGDGISDFDEVRGFRLVGEGRDDALITLSPLDADADDDGLSDGEEAGLGLDAAGKSIELGFAYRWVVKAVDEEPRRVFTDPREPDGDNDQLPDGAEKYRTEVQFINGVKSIVYDQEPYTVRVLEWGNGSAVPTSGRSLIILGLDSSDRLHIRIFDAKGNLFIDADETQIPDVSVPFLGDVEGFLKSTLITIRSFPSDEAREEFVRSLSSSFTVLLTALLGELPDPRIFRGSDPEKANTDGDRRPDYEEALLGTDPTVAGYKITIEFDSLQFGSGDADDGDPSGGALEDVLVGAGDINIEAYIRRYNPNSTDRFNLGAKDAAFFDPAGNPTNAINAKHVHFGTTERFTGSTPRSVTFELADGQAFALGVLLEELDNIHFDANDKMSVFMGDLNGLNVKVDGTSRSAVFFSSDIQALLEGKDSTVGIFNLEFAFTKADNTPGLPSKTSDNDKMAGKVALRMIVE